MTLSTTTCGMVRTAILVAVALLNAATIAAEAKPCDPTDPFGHNPENLCPTYPLPSVNSNTFTQGIGAPIHSTPTIQQPAGRILHQTGGYWTNINTSGNTRKIQDSKGQIISLPNQNRVGR